MRSILLIVFLFSSLGSHMAAGAPLNFQESSSDYTELASHELLLSSGTSGWIYTLSETSDATALSFWYTRNLFCRGLRTGGVFVRFKDPIIDDPDYDPEWTRLEPTSVRGITKYMTDRQFNQTAFYIMSDRRARCVIRLMSSDPAEADYFEAIIRVQSIECMADPETGNLCTAYVERLDQDTRLLYEVDQEDIDTFNLQQGRDYRVEAYVATLTDRQVMRILSASPLD